jgi:hypothetical protein
MMINFNRLTRPFLQEEIKERLGKKVNGVPMVFKYVPSHTVVSRLNEIGAENWSFIIKESKEYNNEVVVLGSLRIGDTVKEAYGSSIVAEYKDLGSTYKSASMLSLVKASSLYNIPSVIHTNITPQQQYSAAPSEPSLPSSCMDCGVVISDAEVKFSRTYSQTYQNKELCKDCQQQYRNKQNQNDIRRVK